jgi:hypothetical protein
MGSKRSKAKGEHSKVSRQKQDGYEIVLHSEDDTVKQISVRLGTLDANGEHMWERTIALGHVKIDPHTKTPVAVVDVDQLPASADACYYQLLCEIVDKDENLHCNGEPETEFLMTDPKLLEE